MSAKTIKKIKTSADSEIKNDEELKPMSHYIDDRLELVKQIFSTLKPKTIKSLSPEFLKESTIEEIQEMCLNELLGISSKRLKSVIYASKCPSDTESSDSNIEENMSLEEISSDSDGENQAKRKKVKKIGKTNKDKNEFGAKNENGKEISVLELLELQARARAIRSQLALEPIAKVELDDSEDSAKKDITKTTPDRKSNQQKHSKNHSNSLKSGPSNNSKPIATENPLKLPKIISTQTSVHSTSTTSKPIKLKRNYAKPSPENSLNHAYTNLAKNNQIEKITVQKHSSTEIVRVVSDKTKKEIRDPKRYKDKILPRSDKRLKESTDNKKVIKVDKKSERSPSPDVLAILPSPEILSVSDSSDDDKQIRIKKEKIDESDSGSDSSLTQSSNTSLSSEESESEYSNDEKTNPEKMEDLRNLIQRKKIREKENVKMQSVNEIDHKENNDVSENLSSTNKPINKSNNADKIEQQNIPKKINDPTREKLTPVSSQEKGNISIEHTSADEAFHNDSAQSLENNCRSRIVSNIQIEKSIADCEICKVESEKSVDNSNKQMKQDEDQQNDDVISLGDAELDYGINDHIEERIIINANIPDTPLSPEVNQSEPEDVEYDKDNENENILDKSDFIDLHDSSGEEVCTEESNSWNDRWLKSSKVNKILAASKLGNKVRDKVKKSKRAEKEKEKEQQLHQQQLHQQQLEMAEKQETIQKKVLSNLEEGSVKQYEKIKEIIKSPKK